MIIRKIDIISAGKIGGIIAAAVGLLLGLFMLLFSSVFGSILGGDGGGLLAIGGGVASVIILPILYGIFGFIGAVVHALIYNVAAGFVGGLRIETE